MTKHCGRDLYSQSGILMFCDSCKAIRHIVTCQPDTGVTPWAYKCHFCGEYSCHKGATEIKEAAGHPVISQEALRVAKRMASGEVFYARLSPRLQPSIRTELESMGLRLQSESPRHESTMYYPLDMSQFKSKLKELE